MKLKIKISETLCAMYNQRIARLQGDDVIYQEVVARRIQKGTFLRPFNLDTRNGKTLFCTKTNMPIKVA